MELSSLTAISPIDGRYQRKTNELQPYFSEFGLIKYRVIVEVEYLIALVEAGIEPLQQFPTDKFADLRAICTNFSEEDALWIKNTEKTTNHDVKAVEYFLKEKMQQLGLEAHLEFVHFGLTSQDINNTAIPLSWKNAMESEILPAYINLQNRLYQFAKQWKKVPLLARTHGQSASPTTLGKEIMVFVERINRIKIAYI